MLKSKVKITIEKNWDQKKKKKLKKVFLLQYWEFVAEL